MIVVSFFDLNFFWYYAFLFAFALLFAFARFFVLSICPVVLAEVPVELDDQKGEDHNQNGDLQQKLAHENHSTRQTFRTAHRFKQHVERQVQLSARRLRHQSIVDDVEQPVQIAQECSRQVFLGPLKLRLQVPSLQQVTSFPIILHACC